ncbi:MAG: methylmalonyl Co-A mutase-associated GTPase MeaB [Cyclobacteriaceae bacterium]
MREPYTYYREGILKGDKYVLAKAITLAESSIEEDKNLFHSILNGIIDRTGTAIRVGVTGVPGVGKSTFIEALGSYLISKGSKVAVLAIDPSSIKTGGSILGDKTRMNALSMNESAFIRPSPARKTLGGVSGATRENILLCEAAGFDVIIIETVGVGQSETMIRGMVDFFLLLMLPGAGDELQGMKRGIMEMADGIIINKADGDDIQMAKIAEADYRNALHLFPISEQGWLPKVQSCSSTKGEGIAEVWEMIQDYRQEAIRKGFWDTKRQSQNIDWFKDQLSKSLVDRFLQNNQARSTKAKLEDSIRNGEIHPREALEQLLDRVFG